MPQPSRGLPSCCVQHRSPFFTGVSRPQDSAPPRFPQKEYTHGTHDGRADFKAELGEGSCSPQLTEATVLFHLSVLLSSQPLICVSPPPPTPLAGASPQRGLPSSLCLFLPPTPPHWAHTNSSWSLAQVGLDLLIQHSLCCVPQLRWFVQVFIPSKGHVPAAWNPS